MALRALRETLAQLQLGLFPVPRRSPPARSRGARDAEGEQLLERLQNFGLAGIDRVTLTRNASVLVSFRGRELRLHRAFLTAPDEVLSAVTMFVTGPPSRRRVARQILREFQIPRPPRPRTPRDSHPDDLPLEAMLTDTHRLLNAERFGGSLSAIPVRVSRRMRSRLGHYARAQEGFLGEIVISRRHIRLHDRHDVLDTLLHEMVHQWQCESGRAVDHGASFREKSAEVGATPRARRVLS